MMNGQTTNRDAARASYSSDEFDFSYDWFDYVLPGTGAKEEATGGAAFRRRRYCRQESSSSVDSDEGFSDYASSGASTQPSRSTSAQSIKSRSGRSRKAVA
eukprot:TRINITY_DN13168_c0_g1_i3.p2 TRINITY_DN13168_c0_g1~~TRINITY_DN13168_c0_g1_i3.p2  ORF type:complete len:101 (-),score=23.44 TRINITY_DN13168_c0_g1_i3:387-689(-)